MAIEGVGLKNLSLHSQSDQEKILKKYASHIIGEPLIPAEEVPEMELLNAINAILFKYISTPGVVPERAYLANSSDQKAMSDEVRFKFGKIIVDYSFCKRRFSRNEEILQRRPSAI